jgi:hypothetical protein
MKKVKFGQILGGLIDNIIVVDRDNVPDWLGADFVLVPDDAALGFSQNADGIFSPPPNPPRYATAAEAKSAVTAWIDALTGTLQNKYPAVVQGGWIEEEAMAAAFEAGTATEAQRDTLQADGAAKNRTPADHAARILANAASFRAIARATRRLWLATVEKIDLENDPFQYEVIMQAAIEEAAPLAAAYGLT